METEKILMGQKQLQRWHLMKMVEVGKITLKEASERIGVSYTSPQARGRIERLFGTLQDRLIAELGLQGVQSLEAANRFLKIFIPRFNRRFAIPPRESEKAWRKVPQERDLDRMISLKSFLNVI
jgi:hypothetical protein